MKRVFKVLVLAGLVLTAVSCKKEEKEPEVTNPYGEGNGQYTFYTLTDLGHGNIDVYVSGQAVGKISHYHSSGVSCGGGDVNVTRSAGSYDWNAVAQDGATWNGSIDISEGTCAK